MRAMFLLLSVTLGAEWDDFGWRADCRDAAAWTRQPEIVTATDACFPDGLQPFSSTHCAAARFSSLAVFKFNLRRIACRWASTVWLLRWNCPAICAVESPWPTRRKTSSSRSERDSTPEAFRRLPPPTTWPSKRLAVSPQG